MTLATSCAIIVAFLLSNIAIFINVTTASKQRGLAIMLMPFARTLFYVYYACMFSSLVNLMYSALTNVMYPILAHHLCSVHILYASFCARGMYCVLTSSWCHIVTES